MADQHLTSPKTPPALDIPESTATVKVSCIDSTSRFKLPLAPFLQPDFKGKNTLTGPALSFLIEHPSRKPILFDLGVRKDWRFLPSYPKWMEKKWEIIVDRNVAEILEENGVDIAGGAIESIIYSHHHWDHVGDASTFPHSTAVVVGPGFKEAYLPGYPKNPDSLLLEKDYEGREVREVTFDQGEKSFKIGRFNALDYFGDGSFYLLDTPGHSIGHICGLARTSSEPESFIFMGGDAAHHGGEFRPTEYLPLPKEIAPSPLIFRGDTCPGHLLQDIHPHGAADKPFYYLTESFPHDKKIAAWTLDGLGEFDAHESVLMLMAHDAAVVDPPRIDLYPKPLNDWLQKDVGKKLRWLFLGDLEHAVEAKERGEKPFEWTE